MTRILQKVRAERLQEIGRLRGDGVTMLVISAKTGLSLSAVYNYVKTLRGGKVLPRSYDAMWDCMEARGMCEGCILVKECRDRWDNAPGYNSGLPLEKAKNVAILKQTLSGYKKERR